MNEKYIKAQITVVGEKYVNRVLNKGLIEEIAADISKSLAFNGVKVHATPEQLARGEITVDFPPALGHVEFDASTYSFSEIIDAD